MACKTHASLPGVDGDFTGPVDHCDLAEGSESILRDEVLQ